MEEGVWILIVMKSLSWPHSSHLENWVTTDAHFLLLLSPVAVWRSTIIHLTILPNTLIVAYPLQSPQTWTSKDSSVARSCSWSEVQLIQESDEERCPLT